MNVVYSFVKYCDKFAFVELVHTHNDGGCFAIHPVIKMVRVSMRNAKATAIEIESGLSRFHGCVFIVSVSRL